MGLTYVSVSLKVPGTTNGGYDALFLVDTGATGSMAPASDLAKAGIQPVGATAYDVADGSGRDAYVLANGQAVELPFGFARVRFMGSETVSKVVFGPDDAEPLLGVTALESTGIGVDPVTRTLRRMAAKPLK